MKIAILFMLVWASQSLAQTNVSLLKHDLAKSQHFFEKTERYEFALTRCQFVGHGFSEPSRIESGEILKHGDVFYHQLHQHTTLRTPAWELSVDGLRKKMLMKQFGSGANEMPYANYIKPVQRLLDSIVALRTTIVNGYRTEYVMSLKGCAYDSVKVVFNTQYHYPEKLTYFFKGKKHQEPRLELQFELKNLKPRVKKKSNRSLEYYLQVENSVCQLQTAFSEYHLNIIKF